MGRPTHIAEPLHLLKSLRRNDAATVCEGRVQTGVEVVARVAGLSTGLRRLGLETGERVCIAALNSERYLEWLLAVPSAGCIIAPLNHRWSVEEASEAIKEVGASMVVVDHQCVSWCTAFKTLCPSLKWLVYLGSGGPHINNFLIDAESIIQLAGPEPDLELLFSPKSVALICFTSGTTGRPKGVSLSHSALIVQSEAKITEVGYTSNDVYLHAATLCHIGGISSALAIVMANGCHILLPKFELQAAFHSIEKHKVSAMIVVPSLVSDMATYCYDTRRFSGESGKLRLFPSMKSVLNGAGSLSQDQLKLMKDIFPTAKLMSAYGMTEACSSMTFLLIHDPHRRHSQGNYERVMSLTTTPKISESWQTFRMGGVCVGRPAPHVEIQIFDKKNELDNRGSISKNFTAMDTKGLDDNRSTLINSLPGTWDNAPRNIIPMEGSKQEDFLTEETVQAHPVGKEKPVTVGNVLTRGAHVMDGYWGRPERTKEALQADGWLDTGDVGWIDEGGRLWLLGRQKDVIKSGGENVYASEVVYKLTHRINLKTRTRDSIVIVILVWKGSQVREPFGVEISQEVEAYNEVKCVKSVSFEVERLLVRHPAVFSAAVVGVPDSRLGEAVTALVRLKPEWGWDSGKRTKEEISAATSNIVNELILRAHCQQQGLSRYKVPRCILLQESPFPVTTTGKVKKNRVREMAIAQLQARRPDSASELTLRHSVAKGGMLIRSRL